MKKIILVLILIVILGLAALLLLGKKETHQIVSSPPSTNNSLIAETHQAVPPLPSEAATAVRAGEGENLIHTNAPALTESTNVLTLIRTNLHSLMPAPDDAAPATPALPPTTVLDNARVLIHNYAAQFGENPVGNNAEITAALTGNNPKQANLLRADSGLRVNEKGELLDAWGTPFFFHQLAADRMEIRSAGEDKKLGTLDDQVTR